MIVVDTDVIASFWIKTVRTPAAHHARRRDPDWIAPILWRSEMRSVLRQHLIRGMLSVADTLWIAEKAEAMMEGHEYGVLSSDVLKLVNFTEHSSYDCEYVALAQAEGLRLVTGDKRLARLFLDTAVLLEDFVR